VLRKGGKMVTIPLAPRTIDLAIGPHLRHAFTAARDAGVALRDVSRSRQHADPRITMRYDHARASLDRHATYIFAAYLAAAAAR
jgi:hypothetical protein